MRKILMSLFILTSVLVNAEYTKDYNIIVNQLFEFEGRTLVKAEDGYSKYGLTKYYTNDIIGLTETKARKIIYDKLYGKYDLDRIENLATKHFVFDFLYNTNPLKAIKIIKKVCKNYNEEIDLETYTLSDNVVEVLNNNPQVFEELIQARLNYIRSLKTYKKYGNGWESRINWFLIEYSNYIKEYQIQIKINNYINNLKEMIISSVGHKRNEYNK
jgi:Putative secretion activating protein